MENMLKKLFDYQKFEKNKNLGKMIKNVEDKYSAELSDESLSFVNAAGDIDSSKFHVDINLFKNDIKIDNKNHNKHKFDSNKSNL